MIRLINVQARRALTAAVWLSILAGVARGQTWTGAISTDWNTAGNWNPSGVPNGDAEFVDFTGSGLGTVNISSSVVETWLTFSNSTGNYTLTSSAGKVLTLDEFTDPGNGTFPPEIIVSAAVTGTETINLANVAGGSLLASTGLVIQNNSTSSGTTLVIGPNTVIGAGAHNVTVAGPGNTQITGSFATGTNQVSEGLTDDGPGTLTFSGNGTNLRGLTLFGGTLVLDYSSNIATKLGSGSLTLGSGVFSMTANSSTPVTQAIPAGTLLNYGHTDILATGSGTITLNAGAMGRTRGTTVDFALAAPPNFSVLTSTGVVNGLLGTGPAFATVNGGSTWATVSGGAIAGLTTYGTNTYTANTNVDVTASSSQSNITVNSLRFNSASNVTMTLAGTNTLQSGGILVTPASGGGTITGGSLTASGGGELFVHDYALSGFTINSALVSGGGLTKTGLQTLTLGGNNTGLTGPININRGTLIVTNPAAVNSASAINLNDLRSGAAPQSFTVDLGNNTAGTIAPPISVSAFSPTGSGTLFSTGNSRNSRVTLGGGIGNDSTTTPITFSGDPSNTSGFNVTGDTSSLFGSVTLSHGFLGISSDSALGDDSNLVMLNIGSATGGGLDFLAGFNGLFSHPIAILSTSRVVVDGGATGTMSSAVNSAGFGPGWQFVKGGTGTLDFSGDGTAQNGGLTLSGGTLALDYSTNTASKVGSGALTLNGGVLSFTPNSVTPVTQAFSIYGTAVNPGHTDISATGTGTVTLGAGNITRAVGGTVDVTPSTGSLAFSVTTSTGNSSGGLLGTGPAFATVNGGSTWATVSGGAIAGLSTYGTNSYASGTNTDVTSTTVPAAFTTNSLRFNVPNLSLSLSGTNLLQSGGILVTPSAGGDAITGSGTLTVPFSGELLIHQYSNLPFTIAANLASAAGLTKSGPGLLMLTGNNTGLTGPVNINRGNLTLSGNSAAVNSASQLNFNDDRNGADLQTFTVTLPNGTNGTIAPPIRLSAESNSDYGTYFTTGSTTGSTITLSGVISTAAGFNSSVRFTGPAANTSGFILSGANTFSGNISLQLGSLSVNSGASLGNAFNLLTLEVNDTANGGLVLMNAGYSIPQSIFIKSPTRLITNGTDSNAISGPISGSVGVLKIGTGTLALTNANNTVTGGVNVQGGTLSLGATGALPNNTNVTVAAGATFSPATANTGAFGTVTLNGGMFQFPSGSGLIDFVSQFVTSSAGGTVGLTGTGSVGIGVGTAITVNGNSTWLSAGNTSYIASDSSADVPITIRAGVTLTNGIALATLNQFGFRIIGGGTLFQNSDATNVVQLQAPLTVVQSRYRVTDASSNGGVGNLGVGPFTLDGGTMAYGGTTATTIKPIAMTANGGTIEVESAAAVLTDNGAISGPGSLTKIGAGTLILGSAANTFSGLTVTAGTVQTANENTLGTGTVTVAAAGVVQYKASTTSARTFNLDFGTLAAGTGATVMLNGAAVNGGFMRGPGTFALTGGTTLSGVSTAASAIINQTGPASVVNFTNNGQFTNAAGQTLNWTNGTNASAGLLTIGGTVAASDFISDGVVTVNGGGALNSSGSNLVLGGDSRTTINPSGALAVAAGTTIELNGGLLVNNGTISGTTDVNYGSLAKGTGVYGIVNVGQGGTYAPGNSPGIVTAAAVNFDNSPVISGAPVLQIELAGTTLGTQYDQLQVTGPASLGGTLDLLPLNGFVPVSGDKFIVMTYANRSGTFSSVTGTTPAPGLTYSTVYLPTSLVVLTTTAGDKTWGVDSDGNSSLGSNWIGGVAPGGVGATATFSTIITAPRTVTLDADTTVGTLKFDSPNNYTIAGPHTLTLQAAGAASAAINVSNVHGNGVHTISAPITLASDLNIVQNSSGTLRLTAPLNDSAAHTITKSGSGTVEIAGPPTLGANTVLMANAGTLRFALPSGSATVGTGVQAVVTGSATLELAGAASALTSGPNRANILNGSAAPAGIVVSGTNQQVGNIDGTGTTQVSAGSDLTANHIVQSALVIGGTAGSPTLVTIDASDTSGNPLDQSSGFALAGSLSSSGPFGEGVISSANLSSIAADRTDLAVPAASNSVGIGNASQVPEPSTLLLALLAVLGAVSTQFAQHHFRCQTV
jgi:fibronectin-binding autotransporter adhesin